MSESDEDNDDKPYEPTQKKLDDAREKGDIPRSNDINAACSYFGFLLALYMASYSAIPNFLQALIAWLQRKIEASADISGVELAVLGFPLWPAIIGLALIFFGIPALMVLASLFAQRAIVFAPSKISPKLNKISPLKGAKNKFGKSGLFEFFKSFLKLMIFATALIVLLYHNLDQMVPLVGLSFQASLNFFSGFFAKFLFIVIMVSSAIAALDYLFQVAEHTRKLRMSQKEMRDEAKESEGDPDFKQKRRQRGFDLAMMQSVKDVPKADVVITNPTHFAVALQWSRKKGEAPVCVAKGQDNIAFRIREIAMENNVPIHPDPPTARAVFAATDIGEEVPPELYRAVAAAIRFSDSMRKRNR